MPKIPLYEHTPQASGANAVRANPNMFNGVAAAAQNVSNAVAGIGEKMADFAIKKQEHVNKGILAREETLRMKVVEDIQKDRLQNPDNPSKWGEKADVMWKSYDNNRNARAKQERWSHRLIEDDARSGDTYRGRTGVTLNVNQAKAEISEANARLKQGAEQRLRAGDYEGFIKYHDTMDLSVAEREEAIGAGLDQVYYKMANNALDAISEATPANAIIAYDDLIEKLTAQDKNGRHLNFEQDRGGMSLGGRVNLVSMARNRAIAAQRRMDLNAKSLVTALNAGADVSVVESALSAGNIDEQTAEMFRGAMETAVLDKRADVLDKQENEIAKLKESIDKGDSGYKDIEKRFAAGDISRSQADTLESELVLIEEGQLFELSSDPQSIASDVEDLYAQVLNGIDPQVKDEELTRIVREINESDLVKPARLKLIGQVLDIKLADFADLEEEGSGFFDRDISESERAVRLDLANSLRENMGSLGGVIVGQTLFRQEAKIRAFFKKHDGSPEQGAVDRFHEQLKKEIRDASGLAIAEDLIQ